MNAPPPPRFDREAAAAECLEHLQALIALDTRNPPGNELIVAQYLEDVLGGIPGVQLYRLDAAPGRANFLAKLRALEPVHPPVLVLGHMDVVGAQEENWDTPPFTPTLRDGYLYGRGAIDDKGMLAAVVTAVRLLAQHRDELTRDVLLLATAAEEGGPEVGVNKVLAEHRELLDEPEFALNEGGRVRLVDGRVHSVNVQTTEKIAYDVRVDARGPSGHGSVPLPDNALAALARAVSRVHDWRPPVRLNETTRFFFAGLAAIEPDPARRGLLDELLGASIERSLAAAEALAEDPLLDAVLRTGLSLTLLDGGIRSNVIPSTGSANFNVRVLPGDDVLEIVVAMGTVAAEPSVSFTLEGEPRSSPPVSSTETALFESLADAARTMAPGVAVMPFMSTGATDGAALRAVGIPTYGILPFPLELQDELRMHGDNERVPLPALGWGTEFVYRVLRGVAARDA